MTLMSEAAEDARSVRGIFDNGSLSSESLRGYENLYILKFEYNNSFDILLVRTFLIDIDTLFDYKQFLSMIRSRPNQWRDSDCQPSCAVSI